VLAELEKLGPKYRLALKIAKDPRFERLHCDRESNRGDLPGRAEPQTAGRMPMTASSSV